MAKQKLYDTARRDKEKAILIGLITDKITEQRSDEYMDELAFLAETAGAETVKIFVQKLGKEIYTINCSSCHGADGKQGTMGASDLSTTTLNNEEISKVINEGRRGKGVMPKFNYQGEQLTALTNYLDSLKTK